MEWQDFTLSRGTAPRLRFRLIEPDPNGHAAWTTVFEVRLNENSDSNTVFSAAGAVSTDPNVTNAVALGVFDVPLLVADTNIFVVGRNYHFRFKRTNVGFEDVLTRGRMQVI